VLKNITFAIANSKKIKYTKNKDNNAAFVGTADESKKGDKWERTI